MRGLTLTCDSVPSVIVGGLSGVSFYLRSLSDLSYEKYLHLNRRTG